MLKKEETHELQSAGYSQSDSEIVSENVFTTTTSLGDVELKIIPPNRKIINNNNDSELTLLHAIQLLGKVEPLICLLEDWLNIPLDFCPILKDKPELEKVKVNLTLPLGEKGGVIRAELYLPATIIKNVTPPNSELAAHMKWEAIQCKLNLAKVIIPSGQMTKIEEGSVLLIPDSFESYWSCNVSVCGDASSVFSAELDAERHRLIFDYYDAKNQIDVDETPDEIEEDVVEERSQIINTCVGSAIEKALLANSMARDKTVGRNVSPAIKIESEMSLLIPLDCLLGWAEQPVYDLEQSLSQFSVELTRYQHYFAYGDLVPVGKGFGVVIKSLSGRIKGI